MSGEKARYRVLRLSFIGNQLLEEGAEVQYDGEPGSNLEPLNDAAKAAKKKADQKRGKSVAEDTPAPVASVIKPADADDNLADLQQQYEELFDKKPHHAASADTLREKIANKRKELGI